LSLENFTNEKIRTFFELVFYKHLPKLLLALDELNKPSMLLNIEICFVSHRQSVRYSSLKKTVNKAKKLGFIQGDKEYSLTDLGKEKVEFVKKAIAKLMEL